MIRFRDQLAKMLKDRDFAQGYEKELQSDVVTKAHITQQQLSKVENAKACNVETILKTQSQARYSCIGLTMDFFTRLSISTGGDSRIAHHFFHPKQGLENPVFYS